MRNRILTLRTEADAERARDARRVRVRRAIGREIEIPSVRNARRRRRCRRDPAIFLETYFPDIFYNPFSTTQLKMIRAFQSCIELVGWEALATERGGGKTNIGLGLTIFALVYGLRRFGMVLGANATEAARNAGDITIKFEDRARWPHFSADFPEICTPVQALQGAPQRARQMAYKGSLLNMKWSSQMIRFPTVPGSESSGAILMSRGLDSAIRGTQFTGQRPDLIILDDPETADSAKSQLQTDALDNRIERDVVGLAGPNRACTILYLGTIAHADCLADRYTDPKQKPAWSGKRYPLLEQYPNEWEPEGREGLWQKYIRQYQRDVAWGDKLFTKAHAFYLRNRRRMEAGAIVSSKFHFANDPDQRRPDGTSVEATTIQFCINRIASVGQESFDTEYQQIPPVHEQPQTAAIDRTAVVTSITGRRCGVLPPETAYVTAGIDINARACHWTVLATAGAAMHIIDYGVEPVHSPLEMNLTDHAADEAVEQAIMMALLEIRQIFSNGWAMEDTGEIRHLDTCLVDAGYKDTPVYAFVRSAPRGLYRASKGFGSKSGQARYRHPTKQGYGRRVGTHWFATHQPGEKVWLHNLDADFWKERVQYGFMLPHEGEIRPGATVLFGDDPAVHSRFADHITAEVRTTVFRDGKQLTFWDQRRDRNHWLDTLYEAAAAAAICGQPIITDTTKAEAKTTAPTEAQTGPASPVKKVLQKMSDMQAAKRAAAS